jgi:AraC-like DNA-binding protein
MRTVKPAAGPNPARIEFDRRKYGRDLLVDAAFVRQMPMFVTSDRPHVLAFHDILLVTEGRGHLLLDGESHEVKPGVVVFSLPGQLRQWRLANRMNGACLFFTEGFVADTFSNPRFLDQFAFFRAARASGVLRLGAAERRTFLRCFAQMQRELADFRRDANQSLRAGLYQTLVLLNRWYAARYGESADPAANKFVARFLRLVDRDFARCHRVAEFAGRLGVSPGHLNALCKLHARCTAGAAIRSRIVAEARKMLLHSELTAAEVSERLGFDDPAYFTRYFRRETGLVPTRFRDLRSE